MVITGCYHIMIIREMDEISLLVIGAICDIDSLC